MYTYDPSTIIITYGSIRLIGLMDGSFVTATRDEDGYIKIVSSTGDPVRYKNGNRGGMVRVTLQQTSPSNDLLYAQARLDEIDGSGGDTLQILDLAGTIVVHATNAWVKKFPDVEYSDKLTGRVWGFDCDELSFYSSKGVQASLPPDSTHAYVQLDGFEIDGVTSEDHQFDSDVTDHPVETSQDVADNVRNKPAVITLTDCIVSNTPIGDIANRREPTALPAFDADAKLAQIRDNREPITIITALRTYDNMILKTYTVTKTAKESGALKFRCVFENIVLVTNERTIVRVAVPSAAQKINKGAKSTKPVTASDAQKPKPSWLKQAQNGLKSILERDSNFDAIDSVRSLPTQ